MNESREVPKMCRAQVGKVPEQIGMGALPGVSSEIERRLSPGLAEEQHRAHVVAYLDGLLASLRSLREDQKFWLGLGPAFRVRFEDFQGDLAMLRAAYRE